VHGVGLRKQSILFTPLNLSGRLKVMAMLHAYMDDSGSHDGSHACVIGGYFGGENRWKEFERRWKRVLDRNAIQEFHAHVFWRRSSNGEGVGEYRGWTRKRLSNFLDGLLRTIEETEIYPFASGVLLSDWKQLTLREKKIVCGGVPPDLAQASANPMFLPFQYVIARMLVHCNPSIALHLFFDEDKQSKPWAEICHSRLRGILKLDIPEIAYKMDGLTFADSRRALPLQAADLLAYEAYRYCKNAKGDQFFPVGVTYRRALRRMKSRDDFWLFDLPRLREIVPRLQLEQRGRLNHANAKGKAPQ